MEGNNVVCLKSRTLLTCLLEKKSDVVEFFIWGKEFFWGGGKFYRGRYRGFFRGGGGKVLGGKVQSPESRVQGPGSSPAFRICLYRLPKIQGQKIVETTVRFSI